MEVRPKSKSKLFPAFWEFEIGTTNIQHLCHYAAQSFAFIMFWSYKTDTYSLHMHSSLVIVQERIFRLSCMTGVSPVGQIYMHIIRQRTTVREQGLYNTLFVLWIQYNQQKSPTRNKERTNGNVRLHISRLIRSLCGKAPKMGAYIFSQSCTPISLRYTGRYIPHHSNSSTHARHHLSRTSSN